jgi:CRP-like cAMP-binding protein
LLPINLYRAREMMRLTRQVTAAEAAGDLSGYWLKPYMQARHLKRGQVLFHKGDGADGLYMVAEGRIELAEIGREIEPGSVFGEIALFSPDRRRTHTARCAEDCTVLSIDEGTVRQLFYQNPAFGFHLIGLVAARLSADVERLAGRS